MFVPINNPRLAERHGEARRLRTLGYSINRIAEEVGVAKSTVSLWFRDIELSPAQREQLHENSSASSRSESWRALCRERRRKWQEGGRIRAREGDPLHVAGCMLYWAEGSKGRNTVQLANSDPSMMEMFVHFLRKCFGLTADDITFSLNVYTDNGLTIGEIEAFWLELLALSPRCARKHIINHFPTSSSGSKRNKLPYGTCSLRVKRSTWLVQHIYGAIQEYSGIDQPQWLDGPPPKAP
jgi:hypothetical protein